MNRKATLLMVSLIGTKTWRGDPRAAGYSRTEGCPALLSPAYLDAAVPPARRPSSEAMVVLKVDAGSGWTRLEDLY